MLKLAKSRRETVYLKSIDYVLLVMWKSFLHFDVHTKVMSASRQGEIVYLY